MCILEACAMICRKATVALPDANPFIFEHINDIFVRFCPSGPLFSGISSTKSRFLCFFALRNPRFRAFRAQNRGFCARLLNWMSGWGTFPPKEASPHLRSQCASYRCLSPPTADAAVGRRCTCAAVVPAQPSHLCSRCASCRCQSSHLRSRYYRSLPPSHLPAREG